MSLTSYQPKPGTKPAAALDYVRAKGVVRSAELAQAIGVDLSNLNAHINPLVQHGLLTKCLVTQDQGRATNEFRIWGDDPETAALAKALGMKDNPWAPVNSTSA